MTESGRLLSKSQLWGVVCGLFSAILVPTGGPGFGVSVKASPSVYTGSNPALLSLCTSVLRSVSGTSKKEFYVGAVW